MNILEFDASILMQLYLASYFFLIYWLSVNPIPSMQLTHAEVFDFHPSLSLLHQHHFTAMPAVSFAKNGIINT